MIPTCGAPTRRQGPCLNQGVLGGRCELHKLKNAGPARTPKQQRAKARDRRVSREAMAVRVEARKGKEYLTTREERKAIIEANLAWLRAEGREEDLQRYLEALGQEEREEEQ